MQNSPTSRSWRRAAARATMGGLALLGAGSAFGAVFAQSQGAGAANTQAVSVTENFICSTVKPVALADLRVPAVLDITAPKSVTAGAQFTESANSSVTLPAAITATAGALGITSITVTKVAAVVDATNATPAVATDGGQGLPFDIAVANIGNPIAVALDPLTFTAGAAGTPMVFTAGDLTVTTTLHGGTFDGTITVLSCAPVTSPPTRTWAASPSPLRLRPTSRASARPRVRLPVARR